MNVLKIALLVGVASAVAVSAQGVRRDGNWDISVEMQMPNMPAGMTMPPMKMTQCVTKEEAKDPQKSIPSRPQRGGGAQDCKVTDYKESGNTVEDLRTLVSRHRLLHGSLGRVHGLAGMVRTRLRHPCHGLAGIRGADLVPLAFVPHEGLLVGRRVELGRKRPVHVGRHELGVDGRSHERAVARDGVQDFVELRPVAFAIGYRMLGSVSEAEDVVQEALLRVHQALDAGEQIASPRAFVATVTTRLAINELHSARARRESVAD